jgi:fatty-acyl-CoA synthase
MINGVNPLLPLLFFTRNYKPSDEMTKEISDFTKGKMAGFKRPKNLEFITEEEMPRTPTGKILHRVLRERYGTWSDAN